MSMGGCAGGKVREGWYRWCHARICMYTRALVFVGIEYSGRGARTSREAVVADAGTNGCWNTGHLRDITTCIVSYQYDNGEL